MSERLSVVGPSVQAESSRHFNPLKTTTLKGITRSETSEEVEMDPEIP